MQLAREPEVEVGIVDQDRDVGRVPVDLVQHAPEDRPQLAEMGDDFEQADDRQVADVREQRGALGLQPVAAQPDDLEAGHAPLEVADELRSVEIARRFAARDQQAGHRQERSIAVSSGSRRWRPRCPSGRTSAAGARRMNPLIRGGL